jgi:hypothetical protein
MDAVAQLVSHGLGDYILQSHWMAQRKTSEYLPALAHAVTYGLPFAIFGASPMALFVIIFTHFVIDRWRLAKYVVYLKNLMAPAVFRPAEVGTTGYPASSPDWLAVWLMIAADNTMHVLINYLAIRVFA